MKIAFVGLGAMGEPMARRLLGAGHDLTVFNRTADKAAGLVGDGAHLANTPAADREHAVRVAIASTLVAGLELAREGRVLLLQEASFALIDVQSAVRATMALQGADQAEQSVV